MAQDLLAGRIRLGVNNRDPAIQFDFLASKNDTVGRLEGQFLGYGVSIDGPEIAVGHARGTVGAPADNVDGDNLGDFEWYAYAGGWRQASEIRSFVTGPVVPGVTPSSNMTFKVTTGGALSTRMQIFSTGQVGIGSASRASEVDAAANGKGTLWAAENNSLYPIGFQYSGSNANSGILVGRKSRGASLSVPANVVLGDGLATFQAGAYSTGWFDDMSFLRFAVDAAVVAGQRPASRFEVGVNANNAAASVAMRINSDKQFVFGTSMTLTTDAAFNYSLAGGVDQVVSSYVQTGGAPNAMIFGFSTYSSGYTNGHPARMYVGDASFSNYIRFDLKLQNNAANTLVPAFLMFPGVNAAKAAFFSLAGSFGSGEGVIFIANRTTAPTANPVGGGILYCEGGALRYRGSGGTTTTIANA